MKKLIGFTMIAVMAGSLFAAEAAQYGWQKGAAANANRSAFFSKVGEYKTEAEREAAFAKAGIGENSPYKDSEHYDVEKLLADGVIDQAQADKIKSDAAKKHGDISAAYSKADFANMSKNQISEFYKNLGK